MHRSLQFKMWWNSFLMCKSKQTNIKNKKKIKKNKQWALVLVEFIYLFKLQVFFLGSAFVNFLIYSFIFTPIFLTLILVLLIKMGNSLYKYNIYWKLISLFLSIILKEDFFKGKKMHKFTLCLSNTKCVYV